MLCRLKNTKGISAIVISAILRINSMSAKQKDSLPKLEVKIGIDNEVPKEIETVPDTGAQATVGLNTCTNLESNNATFVLPTMHYNMQGGTILKFWVATQYTWFTMINS